MGNFCTNIPIVSHMRWEAITLFKPCGMGGLCERFELFRRFSLTQFLKREYNVFEMCVQCVCVCAHTHTHTHTHAHTTVSCVCDVRTTRECNCVCLCAQVRAAKSAMRFRHPILGVHVRRGDSCKLKALPGNFRNFRKCPCAAVTRVGSRFCRVCGRFPRYP